MPPDANKALPPSFKRIAWSNLSAQFSEQIALAAAPLVAVLALGADAAATGLLQTAQTLPFLLLSIPAGVLVDRSSQRKLMVGSEALRALSLLTILALIVSGLLNLPLLAGLGFLGAIGTVCYSVAAPALIPTLVPREQLGAANRWLELARSVAYSAGPALGGAIVGWTGASAAYILATVLSLFAVFFLAGLPEADRSTRARRRLFHELREGAIFVASNALLRPILITAVFFNTSWFVLQAVYVAYGVHNLGLTAAGIGITLGIYGAGMVCGALLAPRLTATPAVRRDHRARPLRRSLRGRCHAADFMDSLRRARGGKLLPVRGRPDSLGDHDDDAAAGRDAECDAGPGFRPNHDRHFRRAADRRGDRRVGRGACRRRSLSHRLGGGLPRSVHRDLRFAGSTTARSAGSGVKSRRFWPSASPLTRSANAAPAPPAPPCAPRRPFRPVRGSATGRRRRPANRSRRRGSSGRDA